MRARQPLSFAGAGLPVLPQLNANENGIAHMEYVDHSKTVLPSVETTDLRACLDAGVNLKQVNTKIFGVKDIVTDLSPLEEEQDDNNKKEGDN